jgi:hypothetical protein
MAEEKSDYEFSLPPIDFRLLADENAPFEGLAIGPDAQREAEL